MKIAIVSYPHVLQSAVHGLEEMLQMANQICEQKLIEKNIKVDVLTVDRLPKQAYTAIVLPPAIKSEFYLAPSEKLIKWLIQQHDQKALLCSVCAGAFILASTGLLNNKQAVTHWGLAENFKNQFPEVIINFRKIVHCDGNLLTAGGMMSWLDLGLELVSRFTNDEVMRQLGKNLVIDTGNREQRFYQQFNPTRDHKDESIILIQDYLDEHYASVIKFSEMAEKANLAERTFLRRFIKVTAMRPNEYLQKLRIQKACDLLESTSQPFDSIAWKVGYQDTSACRKVFKKIMGLSPKAFRQRFTR